MLSGWPTFRQRNSGDGGGGEDEAPGEEADFMSPLFFGNISGMGWKRCSVTSGSTAFSTRTFNDDVVVVDVVAAIGDEVPLVVDMIEGVEERSAYQTVEPTVGMI